MINDVFPLNAETADVRRSVFAINETVQSNVFDDTLCDVVAIRTPYRLHATSFHVHMSPRSSTLLFPHNLRSIVQEPHAPASAIVDIGYSRAQAQNQHSSTDQRRREDVASPANRSDPASHPLQGIPTAPPTCPPRPSPQRATLRSWSRKAL